VRLLYAPGASTAPLIHLLGVGVGTVNLMWNSENGVQYHVVSKPNLASGSWTTNATVYGDGSTIMTNVATGGYDAEFYRLEAQ